MIAVSEVQSLPPPWVMQSVGGGRTVLHDAEEAIRLRVLQGAGGSSVFSKDLHMRGFTIEGC